MTVPIRSLRDSRFKLRPRSLNSKATRSNFCLMQKSKIIVHLLSILSRKVIFRGPRSAWKRLWIWFESDKNLSSSGTRATRVGWWSRSTSRKNWQTVPRTMKREFKKSRTTRVERNARWLLPSRRPVWIRVQALLLLLLAIVMIGSFFEVICALALSLLFPELVLPETGYPTRIFCSCRLSLFFLCRSK